MRAANDGNIAHARMSHQMVFNLLRVNVHAARNDHEAFAVGEIQIALFIEPPDVAKRGPAMLVGRAFGFLRVVMVAERRGAFEENRAFLAHRDIVAIIVANMHDGIQRPANRALVRQPLFARDKGNSLPFGSGIIFAQHRPPPLDHRFLDGNRTWRRRMNRRLKAGHIIFAADLFGQLKHARKMRWHPLASVDPIFLNCS